MHVLQHSHCTSLVPRASITANTVEALTVIFSFVLQHRREEYARHIREQEEELLQQEKELKDRQLQQMEEEEQRKADAEQRNSAHLQTLEFDYSPYITTPNTNFMFGPLYIHSPDSARDSFATDSSTSALSPVPGSGFWESEISEIDLEKGEEGLGFSILDFTVSLFVSIQAHSQLMMH